MALDARYEKRAHPDPAFHFILSLVPEGWLESVPKDFF